MKKGIAPLVVALIAILVLVSVEGVILTNFVYRMEFSARVAKESVIIQVINNMEFVKRALPQAATYSFDQASYYTASRGGYDKFDKVQSYNCISYWRNFTTTTYPNYKNNLKTSILSIFEEYLAQLGDEIIFPSYDAEIDEVAKKLKLSADDKLTYWTETLEISDNSNINISIDTNFLGIYKIGEEEFINTDNIGNSIKTVSSSHACGDSQDTISSDIRSKISSLQNDLNSEYSSKNITFSLTVENIQFDSSCNSKVAARVLIKIKDTSNTYLVYDYGEKTTKARNIELKFYILSGNYVVLPVTSSC